MLRAAFADVVASAHHVFLGGKLPRLTVEELVDYTHVDKIKGGYVSECFEHVRKFGIAFENNYPFFGVTNEYLIRVRRRIC